MAEIVTMQMKFEHPPGYEEMLKVFPQAKNKGVLFCWGDTIYNPTKVPVPQWIVEHEAVHRKQQGGDPAGWWKKYMADMDFRLAQEIPAHRIEYQQYSLDFPNRNMRRVMLRAIAERLSGPLYKNLITYEKAKAIVKEKIQ